MTRARTRWESLTPEQLAITKDLIARANRLMAGSPSLTRAEAIEIAAVQYEFGEDRRPEPP